MIYYKFIFVKSTTKNFYHPAFLQEDVCYLLVGVSGAVGGFLGLFWGLRLRWLCGVLEGCRHVFIYLFLYIANLNYWLYWVVAGLAH